MKIVVFSLLSLFLLTTYGLVQDDEPAQGSCWAAWSAWSECTAIKCGEDGGTQTRTRTCAPSCSEPVQGHWSHWMSWARERGGGGGRAVIRSRVCDDPAPDCGGEQCQGRASEVKSCSRDTIDPVDGSWAEWSGRRPWVAADATGEIRKHTRTRTCTEPAPDCGGAECSGSGSETELTPGETCSSVSEVGRWSSWSDWTALTPKNFPGRQRTRSCVNQQELLCENCEGNGSETQPCASFNQWADWSSWNPVPGSWSSWSVWTEVTTERGTSGRFRSRTCTNPAPDCGGSDCEGDDFEMEPCVEDCTGDSMEKRECSGEPCACIGLCRATKKLCAGIPGPPGRLQGIPGPPLDPLPGPPLDPLPGPPGRPLPGRPLPGRPGRPLPGTPGDPLPAPPGRPNRNSIRQRRCEAAKEKAEERGCSCSGTT